MWLDGIGMVLMQALLGAGASRRVAAIAIGLQWGLFLPVAVLVGPVAGGGLTAIWIAQAVQRALQAAIFGWMWHGGDWRTIRI
jgi:MATE family multidrug resistance protein